MQDEYRDALTKCCQVKYICAQTCAADFQLCFDNFWDCAEMECSRFKDQSRACLEEAGWNDMRYLNRQSHGKVLWRSIPKEQETCSAFQALQKDACDCVPQAEWEPTLKERFEAHFEAHAPDLLNKKGKVKDKKLWKSWKGKRQEMFLSLILKVKDKVVKIVSFEQDEFTEQVTDKMNSEL
mmetsp:Transcript_118764/g.380396  ORF Transcript_118764/g.380396 Transcript_118764/m.380396 type:complete len:181 (-) Transcript_118764:30-572(-)